MKKTHQAKFAELYGDQLRRGSLIPRLTQISLPDDSTEFDPTLYYNGQLIAVDGLEPRDGSSPKRHFCVLLNRPKSMNSPSVLKHRIMELQFDTVDEMAIPKNRELTKYTPVDGNIQGYAFILDTSVEEIKLPPVSTPQMDVFAKKPEVDPHTSTLLGNKNGGVVVTPEGNAHFIAQDGSEITIGEEMEIGAKELKATSGQGDNWLYVWNPMTNGKMLPLPELLPIFPGIRILPNIPEIVNVYSKVKSFTEIFEGVKNVIEAMQS